MRTIQVIVSENDFRRYDLEGNEAFKFKDLVDKINAAYYPNNEMTGVAKEESKTQSSLDPVFGLWKNQDVSLDKIRDKQWERKTK